MSLIDITTEIGKSIIALVDAKTGGAPDKETIVSSDGKVSAIGVKESNNNKAIKTWVGTLEEYEALETIDENTLYTITDDIEDDEVFTTTKVNLDGSNYVGSALSNVVEETHWNNKITNCITEIPQRIKYTLADGTLTIKAGSVVIVPYGTEDKTAEFPVGARFLHDRFKVYDTQFAGGKFFVWAELQNDISGYYEANSDNVLAYTTIWVDRGASAIKSTLDTTWAYDSTTNIIQDTDTTQIGVYSFPVTLGYIGTTSWTSINQVFNGFGYIGSTIWMDKGVKMLISNGYNSDGTIKNEEIVSTNILLALNSVGDGQIPFFRLHKTAKVPQIYVVQEKYFLGELDYVPTVDNTTFQWYFNKNDMKWYMHDINETKWVSTPYYNISPPVTVSNGTITSFKPYKPFRAIDYSDKPEVASWGMPSSKFINLTLGASGAHYTAPANGWVTFSRTVADTQFIAVGLVDSGIAAIDTSSGTQTPTVSCPVRRGEKFLVTYSGTGVTNHFRFVYAEGEI